MSNTVYVVGVGMTKFEKPGRREGWDYPDMARESGTKALDDAGIDYTAGERGARLTAKIVMLGMANKIEWTTESVDAPSHLVLGGTGRAGVKAQFTFIIEPAGSGSKFTVAGDFEGALIKGALGKAVEKDGVKQLSMTLDQLDALAAASV